MEDEREEFGLTTICENCGAVEHTLASVGAICMFCKKGRMRNDFVLKLDKKGEVENCKVLEYSPTLSELNLRKVEMLELQNGR
jgi:uncharacterized OB-fold protein